MTASQVLEVKRSHWSIENQLHWVFNMQFREDESRVRVDNSAENLNVLRHWAYNILKAESSVWGSSSDKQLNACLMKRSSIKLCIPPSVHSFTHSITVAAAENGLDLWTEIR